jgi:hypothetical protein
VEPSCGGYLAASRGVGEEGEVGEPWRVEVGEVAAGEREVGLDEGVRVACELQGVAVGGACASVRE